MSHGQQESESGPDEIVHECPIVVVINSCLLEVAKILIFAFPIHLNSKHTAEIAEKHIPAPSMVDSKRISFKTQGIEVDANLSICPG